MNYITPRIRMFIYCLIIHAIVANSFTGAGEIVHFLSFILPIIRG